MTTLGTRARRAGGPGVARWALYGMLGTAVGAVPALAADAPKGAVPAASPWFEDRTAALGVAVSGGTFGQGWGDFDGDGDYDLWIGNHASPASLFVNQGDGSFREQARELTGVPPRYDAHGVGWADFDNDGDHDLLEMVGAERGEGAGSNRFFVSEGGRFVEAAAAWGLDYPRGSGRAPVWVDWDGDGRLDVALINQRHGDPAGASALFRQGDGRFEPVATVDDPRDPKVAVYGFLADLDGDHAVELLRVGRPSELLVDRIAGGAFTDAAAGLALPPISWPYDFGIADFDGDGRQDVYVVRAAEPVVVDQPAPGELRARLKANHEGFGFRFRSEAAPHITVDPPWTWEVGDVSVGAGCAHPGLVVPMADVSGVCAHRAGEDRGVYLGKESDGAWLVRLSTSAYDKANLLIRSPTEITDVEWVDFTPESAEDVAKLDRHRLWIRAADGTWDTQAGKRGVNIIDSCTSAGVGDFDNDADVDVFLVCGTATGNAPDRLLRNDGGRFVVVTGHGAEGPSVGRGDAVLVADYDRDGTLDLAVTNGHSAPPFNDGPHQLFRGVPTSNHWVELDLVGTRSNRDAIGAEVRVTAGGRTQTRWQLGGVHRLAQDMMRVHVGLGAATRIDAVEVRWPSGETQRWTDVPVDRISALTEGSTAVVPR